MGSPSPAACSDPTPGTEASAPTFWASSCNYFIATTATAIYYGASRKLLFLEVHPLVCGLFFGIAVELVMSFIVLPLSALHAKGPYELHDILQGLLVHMVVVGLPISYGIRRFAK